MSGVPNPRPPAPKSVPKANSLPSTSSNVSRLVQPSASLPPSSSIPKLDSSYVVNVDLGRSTIHIILKVGQNLTNGQIQKLCKILEQKGINRSGLTVYIVKNTSSEMYAKACKGATQVVWTDPSKSQKVIFIVKEVRSSQGSASFSLPRLPGPGVPGTRPLVTATASAKRPHSTPVVRPIASPSSLKINPQGSQKRKQGTKVPPKNLPVEVIDLDSDDDGNSECSSTSGNTVTPPNKKSKLDAPITLKGTNTTITITPAAKVSPVPSTSQVKKPPGVKVSLATTTTPTPTKKTPAPEVAHVPTPTMVPEVDVPQEEQQPYSIVIKGNLPQTVLSSWRLPSKTIVPASKVISSLYRVPDLPKFHADFKGIKVAYKIHPFLGDLFMVAQPDLPEKPPVDENQAPATTKAKASVQNKQKAEQKAEPAYQTRMSRSTSSNSEVGRPLRSTRISARSAQTSIPETQKSSIQTRRRQALQREVSPGSSSSKGSSSSSSSSSSNSGSDDDSSDIFEPVKASRESDSDTENRHRPNLRLRSRTRNQERVLTSSTRSLRLRARTNSTRSQESSKPKHVTEMTNSRALRKRPDGRIYFNYKAKLTPDQYYKNVDLFDNWGKFVRNESSVTTYFKTMMTKTDLTTLVIYHMAKQEEKFIVDRSVELVTDGTIRILLENTDVTVQFMKHLQLETTNDLNALLINLMNSNLCPGVPDLQIVSIYPGAYFRDDVWYSRSCSLIVNDPDHLIFQTRVSCPACTELRKHLQNEKSEIERMNIRVKNEERKNFSRRPSHIKIIKAKPPPREQLQVRSALSNLFLDFWDELGLFEMKPEPIKPPPPPPPPASSTSKVKAENNTNTPTDTSIPVLSIPEPTAATSSDLTVLQPMTSDMLQQIAQLPLPLDGIPIFPTPSSGPTYLTLSDLQFNPNDMQMMPEFSNEMLASLMNSSDSIDGILNLGSDPSCLQPQQPVLMEMEIPHVATPTAGTGGSVDVTSVTYTSALSHYDPSNDLIASSGSTTTTTLSESIPLMFPTFSLTDNL